jgi:RNA polymerase sigma factor (sigma-70 family)
LRPARDPLRHPDRLIRRVYSYVAYRIGPGPDAEDVTSDVFERAVRYRSTFDSSRGEPIAWLLSIARRSVHDHLAWRRPQTAGADQVEEREVRFEDQTLDRLELRHALERLSDRDRELVALRYGADLTARRIGELLGSETNAVEVSLHRAPQRLRSELEHSGLDKRSESTSARAEPAGEA